jgi:hypothetical protein
MQVLLKVVAKSGVVLVSCLSLLLALDSTMSYADFDSISKLNDLKLTKPPLITGLKIISLDKALTKLKVSWDPSPKKYQVDTYAIYINDTLFLDQSGGTLVDISKENFDTIKLSYTTESQDIYTPNFFPIHLGTHAYVWVIAHNHAGWGINDSNTADPEFWLSHTSPIRFDPPGISPRMVYVGFPCIKAASLRGLCG